MVVQVLRRHVELKVRGPSEELLEGHSRFEARQWRSEAEVNAPPEAEMAAGASRSRSTTSAVSKADASWFAAGQSSTSRASAGGSRRQVACPGSPGGSGPEREGRSDKPPQRTSPPVRDPL